MDFAFSPAEEAFRARVREWPRANLPEGWGTSGYAKPRTPADEATVGMALTVMRRPIPFSSS